MRWYRLSIGDYVNISSSKETYTKLSMGGSFYTFQSNTLFPRNYNPTPLNIEFEIHSFKDAGEGSTLCGIRLYNQSVTFYRGLQNYCNKINDTYVGQNMGGGVPITLEAGYDFSNPFMKKLGYVDTSSTVSKIIFKGQMAGITGDFNGKTSHINITGALTRKIKYPTYIQIKKGEVLLKEKNGEAEFKDGKYNTETLHQALKLYVNQQYKIFVADGIGEIKNEKNEDDIFEVENFEQLARKMRSKYKFEILVDNQAAFIGIYKKAENLPGAEDKTEAELNKEDAETIAKLKAKATGGDYLNKLLPKKIKASELITQPTYQGFSNTLEVAIAMRPDITLGSIIELPQVVVQVSGTFGTQQQYISEYANQMQLAFGGSQWMVVECIHRGGFYSRSPESWATILLCVMHKKDEAQDEEESIDKAMKKECALSEMGVVSNPNSAVVIY